MSYRCLFSSCFWWSVSSPMALSTISFMSARVRNITPRLASVSSDLSMMSGLRCCVCKNQYSLIGSRLNPFTITSPIRSSWSSGCILTTSGSVSRLNGNPFFSVMNTSCSSLRIWIFGSFFFVIGFSMYLVNPSLSVSCCSVRICIRQYPMIFPHVTLVCPLSPDRMRLFR